MYFAVRAWDFDQVTSSQRKKSGETLANLGLKLVYGGASVGLMGIVADAVLNNGGQVIGVIPEFLANKEIAHIGLTELYIVDSMHERKTKMAESSDAFIALPGGYGTFEEFCEILTNGTTKTS